MKKTIGILLFILSATVSFGQTTPETNDLSQAEKFSSKAGTLIQREFIDVGRISKAEVKIIRYTDLISSESVSSVRFELEVASSYSKDTKIAALDSDEIDGLIKSIITMKDKVFPSTPENYTEVSFRSRGGFEAGCFWSKGDWSTYLKLDRYDSKSYVFLKRDNFPELLTLLDKAKSML